MDINDWARDWNIPLAAMMDFRARCNMLPGPPVADDAKVTTETGVMKDVRITEWRERGAMLWRNNVGAGYSEEGDFLRWGLANDSEAINNVMKSSDLIGVQPELITQHHVGMTLGLFRAVECKKPGWHYTGTPREKAQLTFGTRVMSLGGLFEFSTGY